MRIVLFALLFFLLITSCSQHEEKVDAPKDESSVKMHIGKMSELNSGYTSSMADWHRFLKCWSSSVEAVNQSTEEGTSFERDGARDVNLNNTAMNLQLIEKREASLKLKFPASYRDFFAVTRGVWLVKSLGASENVSFPSNFLNADEVGLFREVDKSNWESWHRAMGKERPPIVPPDIYYRYGYSENRSEKQDDAQFRWEYIENMIKVGELEQGAVILLNPNEITQDGEWEAWLLSPKSGANRYRSFAELMQILVYQSVKKSGKAFVPSDTLNSTCAKYLNTVATVPRLQFAN